MLKFSRFDESFYRLYSLFIMGVMQFDDFVDFFDRFVIFNCVNFFHVPMGLHQVGKLQAKKAFVWLTPKFDIPIFWDTEDYR